MKLLIFLCLSFSIQVFAQGIKSDCSPAESQVLSNPTFFSQIAEGKMLASDCTVGPHNRLYAVLVINVASGVESYLIAVERKGFTVAAKPSFVSRPLGFDAFPMLVNKDRRLIFIKNETLPKIVAVYMNIQTGPNATRLGRWELDVDAQKLMEIQNRFWPMNAGRVPVLFQKDGEWLATIDKKTVKL